MAHTWLVLVSETVPYLLCHLRVQISPTSLNGLSLNIEKFHKAIDENQWKRQIALWKALDKTAKIIFTVFFYYENTKILQGHKDWPIKINGECKWPCGSPQRNCKNCKTTRIMIFGKAVNENRREKCKWTCGRALEKLWKYLEKLTKIAKLWELQYFARTAMKMEREMQMDSWRALEKTVKITKITIISKFHKVLNENWQRNANGFMKGP